ncbi:MAG: hypothetical protein EBS56_06270 [Planctomycetia bacterium]|nr:hypothetical protein [Planctomycetia bacterium]
MGLLAATAACAVGGYWLSRGDDLVDKTLDMERTLLAGDAPGRAGKRAVDEIIRNVDRMDPAELKQVQQTLEAEWQRVRAADIEAYFAAKPDERGSILDRSIDRTLMYKELRFAVNPKAWSKDGRRPRKPKSTPPASQAGGGATPAEKAAQRQLLERYDDALRQRARERRIELPAWQ